MNDAKWSKDLVQEHAQVAVAIELYTLPFYLTVMTSIKDTQQEAFKLINSVCREEMLHLQLAANLCVALDTTPEFSTPVYGEDLRFLKPNDPATNHNALLNAKLGALNVTSLNTMLDIETPEEFDDISHTSPRYPYNSIGDFYDALLAGISAAGVDQFSWKTSNQQAILAAQNGITKITSFKDAQTAIHTINEQGEGKSHQPAPSKPYYNTQFPISASYQLTDGPDKNPYNTLSHFGRFIEIQNVASQSGYPEVYEGVDTPSTDEQTEATKLLQSRFSEFVKNLNETWAGNAEFNKPRRKSVV